MSTSANRDFLVTTKKPLTSPVGRLRPRFLYIALDLYDLWPCSYCSILVLFTSLGWLVSACPAPLPTRSIFHPARYPILRTLKNYIFRLLSSHFHLGLPIFRVFNIPDSSGLDPNPAATVFIYQRPAVLSRNRIPGLIPLPGCLPFPPQA